MAMHLRAVALDQSTYLILYDMYKGTRRLTKSVFVSQSKLHQT